MFICLGVDEENDDPPLRRDCSCRGSDAGFVHLECLVENAKNQNTRWNGRDLIEFTRPWEVCPICCKFYQSTLAVDISTEFLTFVQEAYPGDTRKQIEALDMRLGILVTMWGESATLRQDRDERGGKSNTCLDRTAQECNAEIIGELLDERGACVQKSRPDRPPRANQGIGDESRGAL